MLNGFHNMKAKFPLVNSFKRSDLDIYDHFIFVAAGTSVNILDARDFSRVETVPLGYHFNGTTSCCFNANMLELYTGGMDRNILVWDTNQYGRNETLQMEIANSATVDPLSNDEDS
jgi:WD40 repeat protein